jgi:hypothetical protein
MRSVPHHVASLSRRDDFSWNTTSHREDESDSAGAARKFGSRDFVTRI